MTPQDQAKELIDKFYVINNPYLTKLYALICVKYIISANPHSNPLNTDQTSTIEYWNEVKKIIEL